MLPGSDSHKVYRYLVDHVVPKKRVATYADVRDGAKVSLGPSGGPVAFALTELFVACDARKLPPLPAIVVKGEWVDKSNPRYGIPSKGYIISEALSPNIANRPRHENVLKWLESPRPSDNELFNLTSMIHDHQDLVWNFEGKWPKDFSSPPDNVKQEIKGAEFLPSPDYKWALWRGTELGFTSNQASAIEFMHFQHKKGVREMHQSTILDQIGIVAHKDRQLDRLRDVFRTSPAWGTLIKPGLKKGNFRLNIE